MASLAVRLPREEVVVYTAAMPGSGAVDPELPFPVVRDRAGTLLPTARVARRTAEVLRAENCDSVLFGASAPLGLLADGLRSAGAARTVALTHGHETWWSRVPGTRAALRRIGDTNDVLTYLGEYTRRSIAAALSPAARSRMVRLTPGVDARVFTPGCGGAEVRARLGVDAARPVIACIARLVPRKGQDALIEALPQVLRAVPDALLLLVGGGPDRDRLAALADRLGVAASVLMPGPMPWEEIPPWFDVADVFAMPCRTRRLGLEPEALGIVFLEASASGLPVVVGDSGGAPDACLQNETGLVVSGRDIGAVAGALLQLLTDPELRRTMGARGREWVQQEWHWDGQVARLRGLLAPR